MKSLVVYSSRTGNTRQVARAVFDALPEPKEIHPVESAPSPAGFDFVAVGFWAKRGGPDPKAQRYLEELREALRPAPGTAVGLFATLGAWPDSEHARECMRRAREAAGHGDAVQVVAEFHCQGRVDPKVLQAGQKKTGHAATHPMTEERRARLKEAEKHPDEADLENARQTFARAAARLGGLSSAP
jgi:flavodoxin